MFKSNKNNGSSNNISNKQHLVPHVEQIFRIIGWYTNLVVYIRSRVFVYNNCPGEISLILHLFLWTNFQNYFVLNPEIRVQAPKKSCFFCQNFKGKIILEVCPYKRNHSCSIILHAKKPAFITYLYSYDKKSRDCFKFFV